MSEPQGESFTARLGWGARLGWMIGCSPELIKNVAWDLFVLFYYSQVVGLSGGLIGVALVLILACDALIDPYVGALSDRLQRAPLGRRHTLMSISIAPFAIGLFGVFAPPHGLSQLALFAWLVGFGLLARISISFYTVPALAMGAELSRDPEERAMIAMLRNIGNNLATLFVPLLAFQAFFRSTPEFPKGQLNPEPYPGFGLTVAAIAAGCMLLCVIGTRARLRALEAMEAPTTRRPTASPFEAAREFFTSFRTTPNVLRLMALVFLVLASVATINQLTLHLSTYLWSLKPVHNQWVLIAGQIGTLVGLFAAVRAVRKLEHRAVMIWGLVAYFACALLSVAAPLFGVAPSAGSDAIGVFVTACRFLGGVAYGAYLIPLGALILDIGDEHEVNTGRPQQGLVSAVHFIGLQAASAIIGLLAGVFLQLIAFPVGVAPQDMPFDKVRSLGLFVCAVIAVASSLLVVVVRTLDVSREKQATIASRLIDLRSRGPAGSSTDAPVGARIAEPRTGF